MGFIRGVFVLILTLFLFVSLFLSNLFLVLSWSLDYDNVAPYIKNTSIEMAQDSGSAGEFIENYEKKRFLCSNQDSVNITFDSEEIVIPCEIINEGGKASLEYAVERTIPDKYYLDYDCSLFECLKNENNEFVLVSEYAKEYWAEKFRITMLISIGLFLLIFLSLGKKHSAFTIAGIMVILSSLPFKEITWLASFSPEFLPFNTLPLFFSESNAVFTLMLMIGILLILVGMGFAFFKFGIKLSNWIDSIFSKMKKEKGNEESDEKVTKEEVKKIVEKELREKLNKEKLDKGQNKKVKKKK
ncbi:MAG: hypothetical protein Q8Q04_00725 [archaeon]|nr:hypothetical protein [archaeon]